MRQLKDRALTGGGEGREGTRANTARVEKWRRESHASPECTMGTTPGRDGSSIHGFSFVGVGKLINGLKQLMMILSVVIYL